MEYNYIATLAAVLIILFLVVALPDKHYKRLYDFTKMVLNRIPITAIIKAFRQKK